MTGAPRLGCRSSVSFEEMRVIFLTHHDHLVPLARDVLGDELNV